MGIINDLMDIGEKRAITVGQFDNFLDYIVGGAKSATGVRISEAEAMKHAAVYSCVKVIAETKASLPYHVYKRLKPRGKERVPNHWLYPLLHSSPNPEMTSMEYREVTTAHVLTWGNSFSFLERDNLGRIKAMWPMLPNKMEIERVGNKLPTYWYSHVKDGEQVKIQYQWDQIWHQRGLGNNGVIGYSVIRQMAESLGLSMAAEEYGARFFSNDSRPSGILKHPGKIDDKVQKRLVRSWERAHAGLANVHKIALLEEGMEWQQIGLPPQDSQFLETRKFQRSEIAGWYRVPPHLIGDLEHATYTNVEFQGIEFVVHCIRPWLVREEQSVILNLLEGKDREKFFAEHLVDGLLRGDSVSRNQAYATARQWGWSSANDVREKENENPVKGGDIYLVPMNMIPADEAGMKEEPPEPTEPIEPKEPEGKPKEPEEGASLDEIWAFKEQLRIWENRAAKEKGKVEVRIAIKENRKSFRESKGIKNRNRIRKAYYPLFKDAGQRLVRKETLAVKNIIEKTLEKDKKEEFLPAIKKFYTKFAKDVAKTLNPVLMSYSGEIEQEALAEYEGESKSEARALWCTCDGKYVDRDVLMEHYEKTSVKRHVEHSTGVIEKLYAEEVIEDLPKRLKEVLDQWDDTRAGALAIRETVKVDGFVARGVFFGAGAKKIKWIKAKGETSPFCKALHGKTTTKDGLFLKKGEEFKPEGVKAPLKSKRDQFHPPLWNGCECSIVVG